MARQVVFEGLPELQRAFVAADRTLAKEFRKGLKESAEPVRSDAQSLAITRIRNMTEEWSRMRVGVTRTGVYVAPRSRGAGGKRNRRNLFDLIVGRSFEPALDENIGEVVERIDDVLATVERAWDRG